MGTDSHRQRKYNVTIYEYGIPLPAGEFTGRI